MLIILVRNIPSEFERNAGENAGGIKYIIEFFCYGLCMTHMPSGGDRMRSYRSLSRVPFFLELFIVLLRLHTIAMEGISWLLSLHLNNTEKTYFLTTLYCFALLTHHCDGSRN